MRNYYSVNEQKSIQKIYAYVDESGQDTKGKFFVVGILVSGKDQIILQRTLEDIEAASKKNTRKWNKATHAFRKDYIEQIEQCRHLRGALFFEIFSNEKKYIELTSYATAKAILKKAGNKTYEATVYVDGFRKKELLLFSKGLRALHIKKRKVRGVRREENNAFIRLADALCGLVRDAGEDKRSWARKALAKLKKEGIVIPL